MKHRFRLTLAAVAAATLNVASLKADPAPRPYLDIPITQSINRDGVIRYGVWVKVGERSVEALIDTGSTGLRVLPSVFPGTVTGVPTDVSFGAGIHMEGLALEAPVEIGSLRGMAPIEVIRHVGCVDTKPDCDVARLSGDSYLIGGDGFPSEGYSAILGIGLPFRGTDIDNPLAALGAKRWIVALPRPYDMAEGHLILDPDDKQSAGFTMLARHGKADADGCIEGGPLPKRQCGTLLFDTGAPAIDVAFDEVKTASNWAEGSTGTLSFVADAATMTLDFTAGQNGGLSLVSMTPPPSRDETEPFILAGITPYLSYDILYEQETHLVGLRKRPPPRGFADAAETPALSVPGKPTRHRKTPKR